MSAKAIRCPNCAAEVAFSSPGTLVVVCTHCEYASLRTDVALESIGKLAMPAELVSHFRLGTRGRFEGQGFVVRGQLQLDHGAGPWNEWCALADAGTWLWLSEAQGRVAVLRLLARAASPLPPKAELVLGAELRLDDGAPFVVSELGAGTLLSAAGELPIALAPGAKTSYADLTRADGGFATLDWTRGAPEPFVGRNVTLAELALEAATQPEKKPKRVGAKRVDCRNCGAAIDLFDPANAQTVACQACNTILEVTSDKLVARQAQETLRGTPRIRLGLETKLLGDEVQVLGFLRRQVRAGGQAYPWSEYLLRTAQGEYRWLVENNGHWLLATPLEPGAVKIRRNSVSYKGESYRHFDGGSAQVITVLGEFYWQVRLGDEVAVDDYLGSGRMLSTERDEKELAVSGSVHLDPDEVARAFQLERPVPRRGVGPLQPNPYPIASAWGVSMLALALVLLLFVGHHVVAEERVVMAGEFGPPPPASGQEKVDFSEPFELTARRGNLRVDLRVPGLDNGWLGIDGALVDETSGTVTSFALATEYYHGIADGTTWSEGGRAADAWVGPVPAGRYRLRLASLGFEAGCNQKYEISAVSDVPRTLYFVLAAVLLLVLPLFTSLFAALFEKRRWDASAHPWGEG